MNVRSDLQAQPVIKPVGGRKFHAPPARARVREQSLSFGGVFKVDAID